MNTQGDDITCIIPGPFCDVAFRGNRVYALNGHFETIHLLEYDSENNAFRTQKMVCICIADYKNHDMNTIHAASDCVYLCEYSDRYYYTFEGSDYAYRNKYSRRCTYESDISRIRMYDNNCDQPIGSRGTSIGQFKGPRICGSDANDNVLIADANNDRFQILTAKGTFQELKLPNTDRPVHAWFTEGHLVVLENNGSLKFYKMQ